MIDEEVAAAAESCDTESAAPATGAEEEEGILTSRALPSAANAIGAFELLLLPLPLLVALPIAASAPLALLLLLVGSIAFFSGTFGGISVRSYTFCLSSSAALGLLSTGWRHMRMNSRNWGSAICCSPSGFTPSKPRFNNTDTTPLHSM
jgi:hypothetical protein